MTFRSSFLALCVAAMFLLTISAGVKPNLSGKRAESSPTAAPTDAQLAGKYAALPLAFEPNQGQTDARVQFLSRGHGYTLFLTQDEAVLEFRKPARALSFSPMRQPTTVPPTGIVQMKLINASTDLQATGIDQLPGNSNYFIGNDPSKWHSGVPNFARVKYSSVYPGIDLVYYGNQGQLEYDFVLQPGADPKTIRLELSGLDAAGKTRQPYVDATGALVAETSAGEVRLKKPVVYQKTNDAETLHIDGRYRILDDNQVAFELGEYDRSRELVIDPVLIYASYLGGSSADAHDSVSVTTDSLGNTYVASGTMSSDFPVVGAFEGAYAGGPAICNQGDSFCGDAFVTKINPSGSAILYSTYLGGTDSDYAYGLAVDASGNAYVTGLTNSKDFPVTAGVFQPAFGGSPTPCDDYVCGDVFVTKLNSTGSGLVYSSYLGGSNNEHAEAITIDGLGDAYVTGDTGSTNFPVTAGAFQTQFTGSDTCQGMDGAPDVCHVAFLSKVNPTGTQLVYSSYLGGSSGDGGGGVVVDRSGRATVSGGACSTNFPVTPNAFQHVPGGGCDIFVSTFNATGSKLAYSTYLGGSSYEASFAAAIDSAGNVYVSGLTYSGDFPVTAGAAQGTLAGNDDAIATKINPSAIGAASLIYSTYVGGSGADIGAGIAVDSQGNAYVTGQTMSTDFPVLNPVQASLNGLADAFVSEVNPQGTAFVYSTYLGGSGTELADFIAVDTTGNVSVAGWTQSADFPSTPRSFQPSYRGGTTDLFVVKISPNAGAGLSFTPATLTFGPQAVGTTSPAQTVVVHDMGSAALVISNISVSAGFAQTNNCLPSVTGGGSCAISITFTPSTIGTNSGSVGVADNAAGSPQKIKLTGTGK